MAASKADVLPSEFFEIPPLLLMASQALRNKLGDVRYAVEVPEAVQQAVAVKFETTGWAICEDIVRDARKVHGVLIHPERQNSRMQFCENPDCTKQRRFCSDCLEVECKDFKCGLCDTSASYCEDCGDEAHDEHCDSCYDDHKDLCGCQSGDFNESGSGHFMIAGHCRTHVAPGARIACVEDGCEAVVCSSCISSCDGVESDGCGGTEECQRRYCKMHRPRDWTEPAPSSQYAGTPAQYCGYCLGDPGDYEEEQDRKRCRRYAAQGEYVHPSHLYDEATYFRMHEERGEPSGYNGW